MDLDVHWQNPSGDTFDGAAVSCEEVDMFSKHQTVTLKSL